MKASEYLRRARALIDTRGKWTVGAQFRDPSSQAPIAHYIPGAQCCSMGALDVVLQQALISRDTYNEAYSLLCRAATQLSGNYTSQVSLFNDTHTHEQVMEMWDLAIRMAGE